MDRFMNNKKGFTLIEVLMVIALLGIVMAIVTNFLFQGVETIDSREAREKVQNNVRLAVRYIEGEIQSIRSVEEENIEENKIEYNDDGEIYTVNDDIYFSKDNSLTRSLNSDDNITYELIFEKDDDEKYIVNRTITFELEATYEPTGYSYGLERTVFMPNYIVNGDNGNVENGHNGNGENGENGSSVVDNLDFFSNVFVYGTTLNFAGSAINGVNSNIVINNSIETNNINQGASVNVSNIFINNDLSLDGGSASLGNSDAPGEIHVNGDLELWGGGRDIYGDLYINGNFDLKDARIHGNVYVNGDLELGWTPNLADGTTIYYTGEINNPNNYNEKILNKTKNVDNIKNAEIIEFNIPELKDEEWYDSNNYTQSSSKHLNSNIKIYSDTNYRPPSSPYVGEASNIIIIAKNGNIDITNFGGLNLSGILFAPNGEVRFSGNSFTGTVIAGDGFNVNSGGTEVSFKSIDSFIDDEENFPFKVDN